MSASIWSDRVRAYYLRPYGMTYHVAWHHGQVYAHVVWHLLSSGVVAALMCYYHGGTGARHGAVGAV